MARHHHSIRNGLLAGSMLAAWPVLAADVTPERLTNTDKEPQNWLMNHRTYDGQRFSPLARINKDSVKGLKLAYAVPAVGPAMSGYKPPRSRRTASSILPTHGASFTRLMARPGIADVSSGAWTRNSRSNRATAAPPCGALLL